MLGVKRATSFVVGMLIGALCWFTPPAGGDPLAVSPVSKVWTEPAAGYAFLDTAIEGARRTIDLSVYEMSDSVTEDDLVARARTGLDVRVLFNSAYEGRRENAAAASRLTAGGVRVSWAPASTIFHAKYLVIDDRAAYIGTGNLVAYDYSSTRDFWVEDTVPADVAAISATFGADFAHANVSPVSAGGLVWSPDSASALVRLISSARHTLLVENEEMDNSAIEQALIGAAERGVAVKVVMTRSGEWASALARLERSGVRVSTTSDSYVYIHAKVICADCTATSGTVFVGSENFSTSSLFYNRELGVLTSSLPVVRAVETAVESDDAHGVAP